MTDITKPRTPLTLYSFSPPPKEKKFAPRQRALLLASVQTPSILSDKPSLELQTEKPITVSNATLKLPSLDNAHRDAPRKFKEASFIHRIPPPEVPSSDVQEWIKSWFTERCVIVPDLPEIIAKIYWNGEDGVCFCAWDSNYMPKL